MTRKPLRPATLRANRSRASTRSSRAGASTSRTTAAAPRGAAAGPAEKAGSSLPTEEARRGVTSGRTWAPESTPERLPQESKSGRDDLRVVRVVLFDQRALRSGLWRSSAVSAMPGAGWRGCRPIGQWFGYGMYVPQEFPCTRSRVRSRPCRRPVSVFATGSRRGRPTICRG